MALKLDFYNEIFIEEQKWIELINQKLLNNIYCKLSLKPFYLEKKSVLEEEYKLTNNKIIGQFIPVIDKIISEIDLLNEQNNNYENLNSLIPLFLVNQMNNTVQNENNKIDMISDEISKLHIKKQVLESLIGNYNRDKSQEPEYIYDDFPEEKIVK